MQPRDRVTRSVTSRGREFPIERLNDVFDHIENLVLRLFNSVGECRNK